MAPSAPPPGPLLQLVLTSGKGHGHHGGPWLWTDSVALSPLLRPWWLPRPSVGFSHLGQLDFGQNAFPLSLWGSALHWVSSHPWQLVLSGSFSKRTLYPWLMYLPILVCMAEIWAIFSTYRPDDRDPRSLLYWCRVQLIRQQRHLPAGPVFEGLSAALGRSFALPLFSQSGQLGGTSPAELGGSVAPLPPSTDIHLRTSQCPCDIPFPRWINPRYPPAPCQ